MPPMLDIGFDAASAISLGRRDHQEDAVAVDFPTGAGLGFAVISDGMGGHAAGDIASKIVVTEVFSELKLQSGNVSAMEHDLGQILHNAAQSANDCVRHAANTYPGTEGMGATLLAPVFIEDRLYWISVGDSPLYLFRKGALVRLNEDHSLVPQIDYLVRSGFMGADEGLAHPDRHCLTSVLAGQSIPQIDCRAAPLRLRPGDVIIAASDGLQFLDNTELVDILRANADASSAHINAELMGRIAKLDDPDQDNTSLCVIKVLDLAEMEKAAESGTEEPLSDVVRPRALRRRRVTVLASMSQAKSRLDARVSTEGNAMP